MVTGQQLNFAVPASEAIKLLARASNAPVQQVVAASTNRPRYGGHATLNDAYAAINEHDLKGAFAILESLQPAQKDNPDYWYALGVTHFQMQNFDQALSCGQQALDLKHDHAQAVRLCAESHASLKQYHEAADEFRRAAQLGQKDVVLYRDAGMVQCELGDFAQAERFEQYAIKLDEDSAPSYRALAMVQHRAGRTADGIKTLQLAIERMPGEASLYLDLGILQASAGQVPSARASWQKVIALDPKSPAATEAKGQLKRLAVTLTPTR
jgi:tetratricopeptide (TPR) repeat protein